MIYFVLILLCLLGVIGWMVMTQPPQKAAALLVNSGPLLLIGLGVALTALKLGAVGVPLILIGVTWLRRSRPLRPMTPPGGQKSKVRTAHLEMELDHDTGEMDGTILTGDWQGYRLSTLKEHDIIELCYEFHSDRDTLTLLESYLNRYHSNWREHADTESSNSKGEASFNTTMSKQEACQILGVEADASDEEILLAWRTLIKKVHPDSGGSAFLAAKINAAKDVLLS